MTHGPGVTCSTNSLQSAGDRICSDVAPTDAPVGNPWVFLKPGPPSRPSSQSQSQAPPLPVFCCRQVRRATGGQSNLGHAVLEPVPRTRCAYAWFLTTSARLWANRYGNGTVRVYDTVTNRIGGVFSQQQSRWTKSLQLHVPAWPGEIVGICVRWSLEKPGASGMKTCKGQELRQPLS